MVASQRCSVCAAYPTVAGVFETAAVQRPESLALKVVSLEPELAGTITYGTLYEQASQLASLLIDEAREAGARVGVFGPNSIAWLLVQCATALAGKVLVPINPRLVADELEYVLSDAAVDVLFFWSEYRGHALWRRVREVMNRADHRCRLVSMDVNWVPPAEMVPMMASSDGADHNRGAPPRLEPSHAGVRAVEPEDVAMVEYTSGTSGRPKGVALKHESLVINVIHMMERWGVRSGEVWCSPAPFFHIVGCSMLNVGCATVGASQITFPWFDCEQVLNVVCAGEADYLQTVPTTLRALLEASENLERRPKGLKFVEIGGAPVSVELQAPVNQIWGVPLLNCYGLTETAGVVTQVGPADPTPQQVTSVGRIVPHASIRIVDEHGCEVPDGGTGQLQVRGYQIMASYLNKPQETAEALVQEGWFRTNDLVSVTVDGYVQIRGRVGDMIKRGAERIEPAHVERVIREHPAVADAAVFGVPDQFWGERVYAAIKWASSPGVTFDELSRWLTERISGFMIPTGYVEVEEIPATESGKILRHVLREMVIPAVDVRPSPVYRQRT